MVESNDSEETRYKESRPQEIRHRRRQKRINYTKKTTE